ncbi:MAG: protein-L-isoaspartate(D-aspartate) O-methyltransferase [Planctomycetota bacterium]
MVQSPYHFRAYLWILMASLPVCAWVAAREPPPATEEQTPTTQESATTQPVTRDAEGRLVWPRPRFKERESPRERMVRALMRSGPFRRAVPDREVMDALRAVPRHKFVPASQLDRAYNDTPLPIGHGQTISQPYIVALMTDLLELEAGDKVLEIGTGSGYQAAVLTELTPYVFSIEIIKPLHEQARECFSQLDYKTLRTKLADGYDGWPEEAPFDAIIVTCAAGHVPPPLWEQLKPGGRMVIPVGSVHDVQRLLVLTKRPDGKRQSKNILPVRFVPMTGKAQE